MSISFVRKLRGKASSRLTAPVVVLRITSNSLKNSPPATSCNSPSGGGLRVSGRDKNALIGDKLMEGSWATPTRTQNVEEPDTSRPPPAPKDIIDRQPKID